MSRNDVIKAAGIVATLAVTYAGCKACDNMEAQQQQTQQQQQQQQQQK